MTIPTTPTTAPVATPAAAAAVRPRAAAGVTVGPVGDRTARIRRVIAYAVLTGYAILMFLPFAYSVATSFKTLPDTLNVSFIPNPFTVEGWEMAWTQLNPPLPVMFFNSLIIATAVTITNVAFGSMAGYAFARLRFPGREPLFLLVLATLMIPDQLRLVPVYQIVSGIGLVNRTPTNYFSVILVLAVSATSIFLLRQYFMTIPKDLEEAAKIDGAGFFTTFYRVMLPLATPALAAVAILQFQGTWNGFFWPLLLLQDPGHYVLPLGLAQFRFEYTTQWNALMAVVVMTTIPILLLYLFFQRYFVEGIAAAGVKG